jgi:hypothetical protein
LGVVFLGEARAATVELTDVPGDAEGSVAPFSVCIEWYLPSMVFIVPVMNPAAPQKHW